MDAFIGTVMMWAPNFAPRQWAYCAGQLVAISQNQALFSLLGTNYGGDGRTTFGLPDMRSRVPIGAGMGAGPGLDFYPLGAKGGIEEVTLNITQMPSHNHAAAGEIIAFDTPGESSQPVSGTVLATGVATVGISSGSANIYAAPGGSPVALSNQSVSVQTGNNGGNLSHENRQPFEGISFIICMFGIFPPRD